MSELSAQQIGFAGQQRFCMLAVLGSGGALELVPPLADDEGRDFEVHPRHHFGRPLSVQVKIKTALRNGRFQLVFNHGRRPRTDPAFWYFAAHLDLKLLDFTDPTFLIPSAALVRESGPVTEASVSLALNSEDEWAKYRVARREVGSRLYEAVKQLNQAVRGVA
jgi:hypothetical protein